MNKQTENIKIIALGGVGEIGKNLYVIEIDHNIFIVDAGLMYPEAGMLGIDMVIPDITYLRENADRVKGIFLTHGHDENIGGVFYVLRHLSIPVYGTKLTLALVSQKVKELNPKQKTDYQEVDSTTVLDFDGVNVSFFRTIHSIPDSVGVCFHTSLGAIVHTGDFKFDTTPVLNTSSDLGKMALIGERGVLCLLSDSTNAERPGFTASETVVGHEIADAMYNANGRTIVAIYASNINRIVQVIEAASDNKRKLVLLGNSIKNVYEIAKNLGYITESENLIIPVQDIDKYPKNEVAILTTGHQGEPLTVLTRMAKGAHKQIRIEKDDTVIISATPVPGNELHFSKTVDLLYRAGANVIFGQKQIHVSGHGSQEELKLMLNMMRPKYFIPINGEYKMQKAHAKLAKSAGIENENIFVVEKGDVIEFSQHKVKSISKVPSGNILIDGLGVGDIGNIVLRDRRLLSQDGILIVVVTLDRSKKVMISGPEIISRGFVYVRESEELILKASEMVTEIVEKSMQGHGIEWSALKLNIREALNRFLFEQTKRRPMILPIIMEI